MSGVTPIWDWARRNAHISNEYVTSGLAEFFGTFILVMFAVGAGCQAEIQNNLQPTTSIVPTLGGCLGLMIAITLFGGVSGAHINPAVSLALAIAGKLSWIKLPIYWFAQFFGGYLGAGLGVALYYEHFRSYCEGRPEEFIPKCLEDGHRVFAPPPRTAIGIPMLDQIVGTSILVMIIMSAIDKRNMKVPNFFYGFLFAITILGINIAFGINAGGVLNPARDFSARLMAVTVGYKPYVVFQAYDEVADKYYEYWLAPFFGTFIGGAVGSILYIFLIAAQINDDDEDVSPRSQQQRITMPPPPPPPQSYYSPNGPPQYQQQPRDWRNTEIRKLPPVNIGPNSPPPHNNNNYY